MTPKATLTVHGADSSKGRRQLILWLERQAKFLRKHGPAKFAKRFTARLYLDKDLVMDSRRSHGQA